MTQNYKINVIELIQKFLLRQINRSYFIRSECLLGIRGTDEKRRKSFVCECLDKPARFEETVKRVKVPTYSNWRSTGTKIATLRYSGDMMGQRPVFAVDSDSTFKLL